MRDAIPLLIGKTDFPPIRRQRIRTLQVNIGYRCNQTCVHCHVNAGPTRTEEMTAHTADVVLQFMRAAQVEVLDLTGGAPELNANFIHLVTEARAMDVGVIDRCNLTILSEPGFETMASFLAQHQVHVVASLPCYLEDNVARQRGKGVYDASIEGIRKLNAEGYGRVGSGLTLDLVFNPQGTALPPPQAALELDYKTHLSEHFAVEFNNLLTITNMPIGRFGATLLSKGEFDGYMDVLRGAYQESNLDELMCRHQLNVDWAGFTYDCDFNQMLGLPMRFNGAPRMHLSELIETDLEGGPIVVRDHCYGCTAGQGSSCGGALN